MHLHLTKTAPHTQRVTSFCFFFKYIVCAITSLTTAARRCSTPTLSYAKSRFQLPVVPCGKHFSPACIQDISPTNVQLFPHIQCRQCRCLVTATSLLPFAISLFVVPIRLLIAFTGAPTDFMLLRSSPGLLSMKLSINLFCCNWTIALVYRFIVCPCICA